MKEQNLLLQPYPKFDFNLPKIKERHFDTESGIKSRVIKVQSYDSLTSLLDSSNSQNNSLQVKNPFLARLSGSALLLDMGDSLAKALEGATELANSNTLRRSL